MADDINKKIIIDVELSDDGQQQISEYKAAFDSLRSAISALSNPLTNLTGNIGKLGNDVSKLKDSLGKLDSQSKSLSGSSGKLKSSLEELKGSSEVVGNAFDLLKGSVASLEGALTGGLSIILTYGPEIVEWVTSLFKGKEAIDQVKMSADDMNQAVQSTDYSDAIEQVDRLKTNIELVGQGILDKKKVLQEYNDTLGKTMGQVSSLDDAEDKINKHGEAYIQMTLLKATANLALQDAAKKAQEAEEARRESDDEALTFWDKTVDWSKRITAVANGVGISAEWDEADAERHIKAMQRRKEASEDLAKESKTQLDIYKDLEKKIAQIAKDHGFDPDGGDGTTDTSSKLRDLAQKKAEALSETEKMVKDSLTRQMQSTYEGYGKEALQLNTHYEDELNKLKSYVNQKLITEQKYKEASEQITNEYQGSLTALMNKYSEQEKDKTIQAQNELAELRINSMKAGDEREKAELQQQQTEKLQELDKADAEITSRKKALQNEMKTANPEELPQLKKLLDDEETAWWLSYAKRLEIKKQTAAAIKAIDDKAAENAARKKNDKLLKDDKNAVDSAENPEAKLAAEKKLITDRYRFEIQQAQDNAASIQQLNNEETDELAKLDKKYNKQKAEQDKKAREQLKNEELKDAKEVADQTLSLVTSSIKQESEAKVAALEKDKAAELSNASLTSGQKQAIEQKYQRQEAQIKIKAFKEEQELSIAQAVINGALAITKVTAQDGTLAALEVGVIVAETAAQVAKIASQKPPAYASGGLHYMSDGRGGLLPGYSKTDNTNAYLRSGEGVVVSEAMRVPWARNLVSAINVGFGGRDFSMANPGRGYAIGGIFTDGGDANRYYNQPVHDQKNLANTIAYQMINNFPPVYVDVKDINNQQNILAQTINRVNL